MLSDVHLEQSSGFNSNRQKMYDLDRSKVHFGIDDVIQTSMLMVKVKVPANRRVDAGDELRASIFLITC